MKITAETVKCARCVNCMNNSLRLKMDKDDSCRFGCEWCFAERVNAKAELLSKKVDALWSMANVLKTRYTETFLSDRLSGGGMAVEAVRRLDSVKRLGVMVDEIIGQADAARVDALKERYNAEYFGRVKGAAK